MVNFLSKKLFISAKFAFNAGLIMFVFMQMIDAAETHYAVNIDGRYMEENKIMTSLVFVPISLFFYKMVAVVVYWYIISLTSRMFGVNVGIALIWLLAGISSSVAIRNAMLMLSLMNG